MTAFEIDLATADDLRDVVHRGVETLARGKIVALPTETVYGLAVSALDSQAVQRLIELKGRDSSNPFAFGVKSLDDALDFVPNMSDLAVRVARRAWPGPLTLVLDGSHPDSVITRLPRIVREATIPYGKVGLRVPDHAVTRQMLRLSAGPMVLTSANKTGEKEVTDGDELKEIFGDSVDLILNDGPTFFQNVSSVVEIQDNTYKFLRTGVVGEEQFKEMAKFSALVVCTGNTCRSPMGEALLREVLAEKLGCRADELVEHGVQVVSAGVAAMPGGCPAPQAVEVMQMMGIDISSHQSQPITDGLAKSADMIFAMTNRHRNAILSHWPELNGRVHTVMRDGSDVSDPIGMPVEIYRKCAEQVKENLKGWADEVVIPDPPQNLE